MGNPDPLCHRIWSKLTALRCNLELFQESLGNTHFMAEEAKAVLAESLSSVEALIRDFSVLEQELDGKPTPRRY